MENNILNELDNDSLQVIMPLIQIIDNIVEFPDDKLNSANVDYMVSEIKNKIGNQNWENAVARVIEESENYSIEQRNNLKESIYLFVDEIVSELDNLSPEKEKLLREVLSIFTDIVDEALERVGEYNITINFELIHPNAQLPTYAHKYDAGADVYCPETIIVPANARGFKVPTGLKMEMPNGWELQVRPRSGMSMKTPLRISNQVGTIDSTYRGEICILFDNFSDKPYTITQGDRIAQFILARSYTFKAKAIDSVNNTERGNGGFGSSGN